MCQISVIIHLLCFVILLPFQVAWASDLPPEIPSQESILTKGHWGVRLETRLGSATKRYDANGDKESLAVDYDGVNLNSSVVPVLSLFGPQATFGTTSVDGKFTTALNKLTIGYGLSKNLTVGAIIVFGEMKSIVSPDITGGTMADSPFYNPSSPVSISNPSHVPIGSFGTTQPTGIEGIQHILTSPDFGYEYKRLESVTTRGLGDPLVGFNWRFFATPTSSAQLSSGVRLGLSKADDPDDLFDVPLNNGNVDFESTGTYQRQLSKHWDCLAKIKYTLQFADQITARAYADGESIVPISRKEDLDRDLGDIVTTTLESGYRLGTFRAFARAEFFRRRPDTYTSPSGQSVSGLEARTKREADYLWVGLTWNGTSAWKDKKLPWPMLCSVAYRSVYRGKNITDTKYWYLSLTSLF